MTVTDRKIRLIQFGEFVATTCQSGAASSEQCANRPQWCESVRWSSGKSTYGPAFYYYCDNHRPEWAYGLAREFRQPASSREREAK